MNFLPFDQFQNPINQQLKLTLSPELEILANRLKLRWPLMLQNCPINQHRRGAFAKLLISKV